MIDAALLLLKDYWFALVYTVIWFVVSIVISAFHYRRTDLSNYPDEIDDLSPTVNSSIDNNVRPEP